MEALFRVLLVLICDHLDLFVCREVATFPVRTNQIPRAIPAQQWYLHPVISCLLGGILPFGAVAVELYFIMSALWLHQVF